MSEFDEIAAEVLAHSEDADEWEQEPVVIDTKPSGSQVISARLPTALADELLIEAERRGVKPSELVRDAVQKLLHKQVTAFGGITVVGVTASPLLTVKTPVSTPRAENSNPVVGPEEAPIAPLAFLSA